MKTLADFKRRLKVGMQLHCYNHAFKKDMGIRPISNVYSNAFTMKTPKGDSWCYYPKAKDFKIVDGDTVELYEDNVHYLTYTFITQFNEHKFNQEITQNG